MVPKNGESGNHSQIIYNNKWLSALVNAEMKRHAKPSLKSNLLQINKPSLETVIISFCFLVLSIIFSSLIPWLFWKGTPLLNAHDLEDYYLAMWQVQGAIAAVALPLLIVVIEFSKDIHYVLGKRPEALIRESWIFPIIILALLGTAKLGLDIAIFQTEPVFWLDFFIVFIGTVFFAIVAYTRMLLVLLSPRKMKQSSIALIKDMMAIQLDNAIRLRISNNLLLKVLQEIGFEFTSFVPSVTEDNNSTILRYHDSGFLCDVHLGRLAYFKEELLGKSPIQRNLEMKDNSDLADAKSPKKNERILWITRFEQQINPKDNGIIRIDNSKYDAYVISDLEAQLSRIIRVAPTQNRGEEMREVIGYVRDGLIDSIRDYKSGSAKEGLDIYKELIVTFLSKLKQWDAIYKRENAIKERYSLGGGWGEIGWIWDDLLEVNEMAVLHEHVPVLKQLLSMPRQLSLLSMESGDYYVFNEFIKWYPYYYLRSFDMKDSSAKAYIVRHCSLHLSEMLRYHILPILDSSNSQSEINNYTDFAVGIIFIFNQLLKVALDNNESGHFGGFLATLNDALAIFIRHHDEFELDSLEYELGDPSLSESKRNLIKQQLELKRIRVSAASTLRKTKDITLYGLNSWFLHMYLSNRFTSADFKKWEPVFSHPRNLEESWEIYSLAKNAREDELNWSFWELTEHEKGEAFSGVITYWGGEFKDSLRSLFCVNCLKILGTFTDEQKLTATLPSSLDTDVISIGNNEDSPIRKLLRQIVQNQDIWSLVIGDTGLKAIPVFEDLLSKAAKARKEAKDNFVRSAVISPGRINAFKQEIIDGWKNSTEIREIVQKYGNYEPLDTPSKKGNIFGFNELQPKDMYVDDTEISIDGLGSRFGTDLASGENNDFIKNLLSNVDGLDMDVAITSPLTHIIDALDKLEQINCKPVVLILNSWTTYIEVEKSGLLKKDGNKHVASFVGYFRKAPTFSLHYQGKPYVIAVDLKKFCVWRQYKPRISDSGEYLCDDLVFSLKMFTEQSAIEAITTNPKLLLDEMGALKLKEDVISDLQLKVHFKLFEQYEIQIKDKSSGYKIKTQY